MTPSGTNLTAFPLPISMNVTTSFIAGPDGNLWFGGDDDGISGLLMRMTPGGVMTMFLTNAPFSSDPSSSQVVTGPDGSTFWFAQPVENMIGHLPSGALPTNVGVWRGQIVSLHQVLYAHASTIPGAHKLGQLVDFTTNNPNYACLQHQTLDVWGTAQFPGQYVVDTSSLPSPCAAGTWTFPQLLLNAPNHVYTGVWNGQTVTLHLAPYAPVNQLFGATQIGQITNFQTNDPAYSCLNGTTITLWSSPQFPGGTEVADNGAAGGQCHYGTWLFT